MAKLLKRIDSADSQRWLRVDWQRVSIVVSSVLDRGFVIEPLFLTSLTVPCEMPRTLLATGQLLAETGHQSVTPEVS